MAGNTNSQTESDRARVWLKPDQVEAMRSAIVKHSPDYLASRNDQLIATLYETGLRVSECRSLRVEWVDLDAEDPYIGLPAEVQKDYPNDHSPAYTRIGLSDGLVRDLRTYLASRWRDPDHLWPSRQSEMMTCNQIRNVVKQSAVLADVEPQTVGVEGADPADVHPHTLRHSLAYRMIAREDKTMTQVSNRLRHASIMTTERVYAHFDTV